MAKNWYIDTSATKDEVIRAARGVFFTKPGMGERMKFWSKAAQMQSNIRWKEVPVPEADLGAEVISGGMREAINNSSKGTGSMIGTTIGLDCQGQDGRQVVQLWLVNYNTFVGINQQGDVLKSYAKQIAKALVEGGATASVHK